MKKSLERAAKFIDRFGLLVLLIIALCIGLYLIGTTVLIAKDGVTFIKYAQALGSEPVKTMQQQFQHPGYPFLIFASHKLSDFFYRGDSLSSWIYSAQFITLLFRLFTLIVLYFIGRKLVGARLCFWALLIFILLPEPAEFGSDALSDWPNLFFLSLGFLVLLNAAELKRWWLFIVAGLLGGMGYLVRPETCQLVVYGALWSLAGLIRPGFFGNRGKAVLALVLLSAGFFIVTGPYMKLKGAVLPKKEIGKFAVLGFCTEKTEAEIPEKIVRCDFAASGISQAFGELTKNVGEMLMWFFVPAWVAGIILWFSRGGWLQPSKFLSAIFIILNVCLMVWLYGSYGYMSRRHTLPLLGLTIFFVPAGLEFLAGLLQKKLSRAESEVAKIDRRREIWFFVLVIIGICICLPKLFRPIRAEKAGFREAAKWLKANTDLDDWIAVPDKRISFYAERKELVYEGGNIPADAVYIVAAFEGQNEEAFVNSRADKLVYRNEKAGVVIYRK